MNFRTVLTTALVWAILAFQSQAATLAGKCVEAYDGDTITILVDGKKERIRLIGIDTPEMAQAPWGQKARDFTRGLVLNKEVRVETDVEPRDRYGRMLGYVYVGDVFVNLEIIEAGYAMLLTYPPNVAHTSDFTKGQQSARDARLNIWDSTNGLTESPHDFRHGGHKKGRYESTGGKFTIKSGQETIDRLRAGNADVASPQRIEAPQQSRGSKGQTGTDVVSMNRNSRKYHEPGCRYFGCSNCEEVPRAEAEKRGVPCKVCH